MLKNNALTKSQGFTLLEMIIVIAIAGLIMSGIAVAIQKTVSHKTRKLESEAVVQEIENFLRFVNTDEIGWYSTVNNNPNPAVNPLYDTGANIKGNEIYKISDPGFSHLKENTVDVSPFFKRVYYPSGNPVGIPHAGLFSAGNGRNYYSWPLMWSAPGVRENFLDGLCLNKGHTGFKEQYLTCRENPLLRSGSLSIERIDLVSSDGTINHESPAAPAPANTKSSGIDRVDVFVAYKGDINEPAKMYTYFLPVTDAFDKSGLAPNPDDSMYLVERTGADWQFVSKRGQIAPGVPVNSADLISYRDLPGNINHLHAGHHYGIRFSFGGNGKFLKPDGSVSTSKLCWNAQNNIPGPCLVPSNDGGTLMAQDGKNRREMANLQAASVIMKRVDPVTHVAEYYTAPYIQTQAFSNITLPPCRGVRNINGQAEVYCGWPSQPATLMPGFPGANDINTNGAITVSQPECPQAVDEATHGGITLHRRLDVSIKEVLAGLPNITNVNGADYAVHGVSAININRLGGVNMSVSRTRNDWRVVSVVGIEDINNAGNLWQYINPPWLSVQLSMWCSSLPQP